MKYHIVTICMKNKSKSPFKDKPLRYVAQSADEKLNELLHDKILMDDLAACGLAVLIFYG